jgi:hypothetical protein
MGATSMALFLPVQLCKILLLLLGLHRRVRDIFGSSKSRSSAVCRNISGEQYCLFASRISEPHHIANITDRRRATEREACHRLCACSVCGRLKKLHLRSER